MKKLLKVVVSAILFSSCWFFFSYATSIDHRTEDLINNPKFKALIDAFAKITQASQEVSLDEARRLCTQFFLPSDVVPEEVKRVENIEILGKDHNKIKIRIFVPDSSSAELPLFVYFHRGGWIFGNIEEADPVCRKLANRLGCVIASVDYRLAPENPFPKPLDDCYAATQWLAENCEQFGGNKNQLIVGGESAGGNLAAAVSLMARDLNGPAIAAQILIYPMITSLLNDESYENCVDQYFMTKGASQFMWAAYLQDSEASPYASLDRATDLSNLPSAIIITAEFDPLRQEAENYAHRLSQAGVKTLLKSFPKVIHGFLDLPIYEESQKNTWIVQINELLNSLLNLCTLERLDTNQDYWKPEEYNRHSTSQKDSAKSLIEYVPIKDDSKILDVGCGDGKITAEIANNIPKGSIVGVDIAPSMIEFAKATFSQNDFPNLKFALKDAQALDFNEEFDIIFSFTTLQWVQNHDDFLKGAYQGLKPSGTLAITMPLGLPSTLEQAVTEIVSSSQWSLYFQEFSTGWNFVQDTEYRKLLSYHRFVPSRVAVVAQKDVFPSREVFEKFISQWFPYLRPLPEDLKSTFLAQVIDRFLELESPFPNNEVHFKIQRLEIVAIKL